ncbi:MAG: oxidoreductase [Chloroflexota bacterium]
MSNNWTTDNIPDLTGKVAIVTGANSGLGLETAKEFARKSAQTILACRSMDKAQTALVTIQSELPDAQAEIMQLNLASLASVRAFAEAFKAKYDQLDILANNAGIMMVPYDKTEDDFERQMGTNHLGHFALTGLLFDLISQTPCSRVVNVSSSGHRMGKMDFDNLLYDDSDKYTPAGAYGRSKLANLLFTRELQKRFEAQEIDAMALASHPGGSDTNLGNHLEDSLWFKLLSGLMGRMMQSAAMGALPTIRAAVDPSARGGQYYGPNGFMEMSGAPILVKSSKAAQSDTDARRLWEMSEELTGVRYGE